MREGVCSGWNGLRIRCNKIRSPVKDKVRRPDAAKRQCAHRTYGTSRHRPPADEKIDRRHIRAGSSRLRCDAMRCDPTQRTQNMNKAAEGVQLQTAAHRENSCTRQQQKRTRCPRKLRPGSKYSQGASKRQAACRP